MGLTLRCRRYIFLARCLHLELIHGFPGLRNVDLIVASHSYFSPFCGFPENNGVFREKRSIPFRITSFSRIGKAMSENESQDKKKMDEQDVLRMRNDSMRITKKPQHHEGGCWSGAQVRDREIDRNMRRRLT